MPRVATIYLHSSKEQNLDLGEDLGLEGDALKNFMYALYEVEAIVDVAADGSVTIDKVNGRMLEKI